MSIQLTRQQTQALLDMYAGLDVELVVTAVPAESPNTPARLVAHCADWPDGPQVPLPAPFEPTF